MKMLNIDDTSFLRDFKAALGINDGDTVSFVTPQFERTDGVVPVAFAGTWAKLPLQDKQTLKDLGCGQWDDADADGTVLMLFPKEWYAHIPNGYMIECIDGSRETFCRGQTDDDYRFGCLAYGVRVKEYV